MITYVLVLALVLLCIGAPALAQERSALIARGKQYFMDQGCYGCHTLGKTGTPIAPDLTDIGSRYPQSYLADWLRDPSAQKPTAHMPKIELTDEEVRALAAYLASLR